VTPISPRFAPALLVVAIAYATFVAADAGLDRSVDTCRDPKALVAPGLFPPEAEPQPRLKPKHISAFAWDRRLQTVAPHLDFEQVFARSFEPSDFFASSSAFLPQRQALFARAPVADELVVDGERVPIQVTHFESVQAEFYVVALLIDGQEPTDNVFTSRLARPLEGLVWGRKPITAFVSSVTTRRGELPLHAPAVRDWLARAWRRFRAACGAPASDEPAGPNAFSLGDRSLLPMPN
jgi:hypothetical protein